MILEVLIPIALLALAVYGAFHLGYKQGIAINIARVKELVMIELKDAKVNTKGTRTKQKKQQGDGVHGQEADTATSG